MRSVTFSRLFYKHVLLLCTYVSHIYNTPWISIFRGVKTSAFIQLPPDVFLDIGFNVTHNKGSEFRLGGTISTFSLQRPSKKIDLSTNKLASEGSWAGILLIANSCG